jgi:hypothetical protein
MVIWSDEEVSESDDSRLLIANKAAANRILKEQDEDTQYKRRTVCRYRLESA